MKDTYNEETLKLQMLVPNKTTSKKEILEI